MIRKHEFSNFFTWFVITRKGFLIPLNDDVFNNRGNKEALSSKKKMYGTIYMDSRPATNQKQLSFLKLKKIPYVLQL